MHTGWEKTFLQSVKRITQKLTVPAHNEIGEWMHPDAVSGEFYYFFGPMVKDKSFTPNGMEALDIPVVEYAVSAVPKGDSARKINENVRKTRKYIFAEWFDNSGYKLDERKMDFNAISVKILSSMSRW